MPAGAGRVVTNDLLLMARYDAWATGRALEAAGRLGTAAWTRPLAGPFACLRDGAVHLVSAATVWLARWQGRPMATGLRAAAFADAAAVQARWREVAAAVGAFLASLPEPALEAPLAYRTATGRSRQAPLAMTIVHLFTHAAYHRGQLMATIRQLGGPTVHTDLLYFLHDRGRVAG